MLTPEEIETLAKQYAEFTDLSVVDQLRVKLISKEFLTWMLRDYCIVPKSKVRENYQSLKNNIPDFKDNPDHHCGFLGGMTELELLFGKSLFEEEK